MEIVRSKVDLENCRCLSCGEVEREMKKNEEKSTKEGIASSKSLASDKNK